MEPQGSYYYHPVVDLMADPLLSGKAVLYMAGILRTLPKRNQISGAIIFQAYIFLIIGLAVQAILLSLSSISPGLMQGSVA